MKKEPFKRTLQKNKGLSIYNYIKLNGKLPKPSYLKISQSTLERIVKLLKEKGNIKKIGYGVWKTTLQPVWCYPPDIPHIRGHNFVFTIKLPKIPGWHKREQYLIKKKVDYKVIPQGYRIKLKGKRIWLCSKTIVIYMDKDYSSSTATKAKQSAIRDLYKVIKSIEYFLNYSIKINKRYYFKICRQHYAKVKDELAKLYRKEGKRLTVANEDGVWLITDFSLNMDELETVHPKTSKDDMDEVIMPFYNTVKQYHKETGRNLAKDLVTAHKLYAENIVSHIKAIQDLGTAVKVLSKKIEKFK